MELLHLWLTSYQLVSWFYVLFWKCKIHILFSFVFVSFQWDDDCGLLEFVSRLGFNSHPTSWPFSGQRGLKLTSGVQNIIGSKKIPLNFIPLFWWYAWEPKIKFSKFCKPEVSRKLEIFFIIMRFLWYKEPSEYARLFKIRRASFLVSKVSSKKKLPAPLIYTINQIRQPLQTIFIQFQ